MQVKNIRVNEMTVELDGHGLESRSECFQMFHISLPDKITNLMKYDNSTDPKGKVLLGYRKIFLSIGFFYFFLKYIIHWGNYDNYKD